MAEEKTYVFDSNSGRSDIPLAFALNGNGFNNGYGYGNGFFGGSGFGAGILGGLLGGLIWGGLGNGFGGWGGFNGGAGYLGNTINNDNNTDLIMQAINGTDSDVRLLATTLNADVNEVRSAVSTMQLGIQQVAGQVGMSGLQVINAIQSGDAQLSRQLCEACYNNQIATLEQTNTLGAAITDLKTTMVKEFCDVKEREMQDKISTQNEIISQLRGQIDNANQTAAITGYINSVITPLQRDVDKIRENQPNTVPVQWPNIQAVNTTPYVSGGFYGNGFFGNGFGNSFWGSGSIWS